MAMSSPSTHRRRSPRELIGKRTILSPGSPPGPWAKDGQHAARAEQPADSYSRRPVNQVYKCGVPFLSIFLALAVAGRPQPAERTRRAIRGRVAKPSRRAVCVRRRQPRGQVPARPASVACRGAAFPCVPAPFGAVADRLRGAPGIAGRRADAIGSRGVRPWRPSAVG
jgi:hypothetical protein